MAIEVTIKQTEPRTVAFIAMRGSYDQIGTAFPRLYRWLAQKGYGFVGPPTGVYFNSPKDVAKEELTWELQCPIMNNVSLCKPDASGCGIKHVDSIEVATAIHIGPFNKVGATYEMLSEWVNSNGYCVAGPSQEVYLSDPAITPEAERITEVRLPIKRTGH